jgi:hypothetical protein
MWIFVVLFVSGRFVCCDRPCSLVRDCRLAGTDGLVLKSAGVYLFFFSFFFLFFVFRFSCGSLAIFVLSSVVAIWPLVR